MNSLGQIIHDTRSDKGIHLSFDTDQLNKVEHWLDQLNKYIDQAVCFDIGDIDNFQGTVEFAMMPYPLTWFEFFSENYALERFGAIVNEYTKNNRIYQEYGVFVKKENQPWALLSIGKYYRDIESQKNYYWCINGADRTATDNAHGLIMQSVLAMQCTNVEIIETKPSKTRQLLNKNKKIPLFSTWTLHIKPNRTKKTGSDQLSRKHNPPRLHLRRGHRREYSPGKYTWVRSCMAGGKTPGAVVKDYKLET